MDRVAPSLLCADTSSILAIQAGRPFTTHHSTALVRVSIVGFSNKLRAGYRMTLAHGAAGNYPSSGLLNGVSASFTRSTERCLDLENA